MNRKETRKRTNWKTCGLCHMCNESTSSRRKKEWNKKEIALETSKINNSH